MTQWQVVLVIISLITLVAGVTGPVVKLNTNITKLNVVLDGLKTDFSKLEAAHERDIARIEREGSEKRKRIHEKLENHENRITLLEKE